MQRDCVLCADLLGDDRITVPATKKPRQLPCAVFSTPHVRPPPVFEHTSDRRMEWSSVATLQFQFHQWLSSSSCRAPNVECCRTWSSIVLPERGGHGPNNVSVAWSHANQSHNWFRAEVGCMGGEKGQSPHKVGSWLFCPLISLALAVLERGRGVPPSLFHWFAHRVLDVQEQLEVMRGTTVSVSTIRGCIDSAKQFFMGSLWCNTRDVSGPHSDFHRSSQPVSTDFRCKCSMSLFQNVPPAEVRRSVRSAGGPTHVSFAPVCDHPRCHRGSLASHRVQIIQWDQSV